YLYEHLAFGHLYFSDSDDPTFFSLVRSSTAPHKKLSLIATPRPYDDPKVEKVYYRLQRVDETIVDKSHLPYSLYKKTIRRFKELFWAPDYQVFTLPKHTPKAAANPFETFKAIPAKSRYLFLLDDSHFFISNFIKGPVCWGPISLNVINDRFLELASPVLSLPAEMENNFKLTAAWTLYSRQQKKYLQKKDQLLQKNNTHYNTEFIWPGNGPDGDGALTIFRHYDSATVLKGFIGDEPKTVWVIDYPIFERIYYLLVAGFDVYGNVGHQLSTRLYMDFLRMEGERNFIRFLPSDMGISEQHKWYKSIPPHVEKFLFDRDLIVRDNPLDKQESDNSKFKTLQQFSKRTQTSGENYNASNYWNAAQDKDHTADAITKALFPITLIKGKNLRHLPDLSYLRIKTANSNDDPVYTLIKNNAHSSVHFMFGEDLRRLPKGDTLTLVRGIVGSYPNYIYTVPFRELEEFTEKMHHLKKEKSAVMLNEKWGLRRTHPQFWEEIDWLQEKNKSDYGPYAGLFDLNRYLNQ
ncbi:MAG: fatty acid cis/trans isomerase, partial [Pseudomonadales bacterium]|nr:fatty acid cis/trans isomerase [Pseudomonadales bacterium]